MEHVKSSMTQKHVNVKEPGMKDLLVKPRLMNVEIYHAKMVEPVLMALATSNVTVLQLVMMALNAKTRYQTFLT